MTGVLDQLETIDENLFDVISDIMDEKREDWDDWVDEQEDEDDDDKRFQAMESGYGNERRNRPTKGGRAGEC